MRRIQVHFDEVTLVRLCALAEQKKANPRQLAGGILAAALQGVDTLWDVVPQPTDIPTSNDDYLWTDERIEREVRKRYFPGSTGAVMLEGMLRKMRDEYEHDRGTP